MQDPFEHIGQQLRDLEINPSGAASFEEVMKRREKKRRGFFFWFQRVAVVAILGLIGYLAWYKGSENIQSHSSEKLTNNQTSTSQKTTESAESTYSSSPNDPVDIEDDGKNTQNTRTKSKSLNKQKPKKATSKTGLFGVFEKFNDQRARMLKGSTATAQRTNGAEKSLLESSEGHKTLLAENSVHAEQRKSSELLTTVSEMSLSNVYDFGAKNYIKSTLYEMNIPVFGDEYLDWNFDIPSSALRYQRKPWYLEFSAITGSDNQIQFDPEERLSILGTNYMAQYQLNWLRDCEDWGMWGIGVQYTQWAGNGEWRKKEYLDIQQIDTQLVAINVPGLPTQFIQTYDTSWVKDYNVSTGSINYHIDKIAIPLAFRGFKQILKTNFRYAIQLSPGVTRISKGSYFTPTEFMALETKTQFTMGAKIGAGPMIPINNNLSIVIEPAIMYQSFVHPENGLKGRVFGGLGISMMWRLR